MSKTPHLIFIHGLSNKPPAKDLRRIWLDALSEQRGNNPGFDLGAVGVRETFIYWADLFYDEPLSVADYESRSNELGDSVSDDLELTSDAWMEAMKKKFPVDPPVSG